MIHWFWKIVKSNATHSVMGDEHLHIHTPPLSLGGKFFLHCPFIKHTIYYLNHVVLLLFAVSLFLFVLTSVFPPTVYRGGAISSFSKPISWAKTEKLQSVICHYFQRFKFNSYIWMNGRYLNEAVKGMDRICTIRQGNKDVLPYVSLTNYTGRDAQASADSVPHIS